MIKILRFLRIIQTVSNEERHKKGLKRLGRGYFEAHRLNPYNPFSYITAILILVIGLLMFGVVGFWKEINNINPFKWD
jgi:hypothetical protein